MEHAFALGANTRDLIDGTLLLDANTGQRGWSPTFCGRPCGFKERNNESWLGKGSYFLSTRATGNHSLVGGFEEFHQKRNENNFQSGSDLRIHGNFIYVGQDVEHFRLRHALVVPQRQVGAERPLELQRGSSS
jgi:hypothetical protein